MFSRAPFLFVAVPGTAAVGLIAAILASGPLTASEEAFLAPQPGLAANPDATFDRAAVDLDRPFVLLASGTPSVARSK